MPAVTYFYSLLKTRRNYDVWNASSFPGPNAPLSDACHNSQPLVFLQLMLGLALYGYVSNSTQTTLQHIAQPPAGFSMSQHKQHVLNNNDKEFAQDPTTQVGCKSNFLDGNHVRSRVLPVLDAATAPGGLSAYWGQQIPFNQIVQLGALVKMRTELMGKQLGIQKVHEFLL